MHFPSCYGSVKFHHSQLIPKLLATSKVTFAIAAIGEITFGRNPSIAMNVLSDIIQNLSFQISVTQKIDLIKATFIVSHITSDSKCSWRNSYLKEIHQDGFHIDTPKIGKEKQY